MRSNSKTITISTVLSVGLILAAGQMVVDQVVSNRILQQFDVALKARARELVFSEIKLAPLPVAVHSCFYEPATHNVVNLQFPGFGLPTILADAR